MLQLVEKEQLLSPHKEERVGLIEHGLGLPESLDIELIYKVFLAECVERGLIACKQRSREGTFFLEYSVEHMSIATKSVAGLDSQTTDAIAP